MSETLPRGWAATTLDEITQGDRPICYGILMPKEHVPGGIPYVKVKHIRDGIVHVDELLSTTPAIHQKYRRSTLATGDLLVTIRGTYGRTALTPPELNGGNVTQDTARVSLVDDVDRRFVKYAIATQAVERYFSRVARGVAVKGVNIGDLRLTPISLPPVAEQRRIVEALDTHFTRLDAAVATLKRVRANLNRYRAAVLHAAVEGRLVGERVQFPIVQLGTISESIRNGYSKKPEGASGIPILRISAVRPMRVHLDDVRHVPSDSTLGGAFVENGDVMFTRYNGSRELVGVCGVVRGLSTPMAYPDKLIRVRLCAARVSPDWLEIAGNSGLSRAFIESRMRTTAGQSGVSGADLKQMPLPLPSIDMQQRVVEAVAERLSIADSVARQIEDTQARSSRLVQSLLCMAFDGRLVPQDPRDEPASVLLDRIRAERTGASSSPKKKSPRINR